MLVKKGGGFKSGEITPYDMYLNRRAFIFGAAAAFALGLAARTLRHPPASRSRPPPTPPTRSRIRRPR